MKISTFGFLTRRGVRNLGKHWAMTIACIASLSVCMTLNIFASLIEVNVDSMVSYLGSQNEMVVYVDPEADDATIQSVGNALSGTAGVSRVQYMSKEDVLNQYCWNASARWASRCLSSPTSMNWCAASTAAPSP